MGGLHLGPWVGDLLSGLWVTVYITILGGIAALIIAFVLGLLARMENILLRGVARTVIEFFRGTSLLVQLFWFYYAMPIVTGIELTPTQASVIALGLNLGAYGAEVVRGAINAVPAAQWEGAVALSFTPVDRMRRVIIPQSIPLMIPPFNNLLIQLLKSTPLVFLIAVIDLTKVAAFYRQQEGHELFIYSLLLVVYLALSYLFTLGMHVLEARAKARLGQVEERRKLFSFRGPMEEEAERA